MERIRDERFQARAEEPLDTDSHQTNSKLACSQSLYFLFKVRLARVIKNKNRGEFIDRQRKGVGAGEEENIYFSFSLARALANIFQKNENKNKTTSVYGLFPYGQANVGS